MVFFHFSGASPSASEEPGTDPASFGVAISLAPVTSIPIEVTWEDTQLHSPVFDGSFSSPELARRSSSSRLIHFTPSNWATPINVSIMPIFDGLNEDKWHGGWMSFRAVTSTPNLDPRFLSGVQRGDMTVRILDYGCPATDPPMNSNISCFWKNTTNQLCFVVCKPGYTFNESAGALVGNYTEITLQGMSIDCEICALLTCDKGAWNSMVPQCSSCAAGYFRQNGACVPCSTRTCPVGQYRGKCGSSRDAVCQSCIKAKPVHSHFTSGGKPFDVDNCTWECDDDYILERVGSEDSKGEYCKKIPLIDIRPDPYDSDLDGW